MTNEYGDNDGVTAAATEVINGVTYQVIELPGDRDPGQTQNLIKTSSADRNGNYHYILMDDWDLVASHYTTVNVFYCKNIIFDCNGHRVNSGDAADRQQCYLNFYNVQGTLEITDTAVTGGGYIYALGIRMPTLILAGNGQYILENGDQKIVNTIIRGGRRVQLRNYSAQGVACYNLVEVAPYMRLAGADFGIKNYEPRADYFAVSTSEMIAGVYNYVYGYVWDLTVWELSKLAVPNGKTYYLWGRNKDGWYRYLNLRYVDGKWQ